MFGGVGEMSFKCLEHVNVCFRNRRSAQGDRLSAITMALQAGSESDEDSLLSGKHSVHYKIALRVYIQNTKRTI